MGSRVSSELVKLPMVGTTWYRRGAGYWLRRISTGCFLLALSALVMFLAVALFQGVIQAFPESWHTAGYVVEAAASVAAAVWGWVFGRRQVKAKLADPPTPDQAWTTQRRAKIQGAGAVGGRGLVLLMAPVMPAVIAWWIGAVCAGMFVRELPSEVGARRAMAAHH
ncbi:hypothetical protein AB0G73_35390 [Streptomyces sp. NPDC020719]|uniref:hypothetical protein n=1 Tax=Streptomyces sp. NPDC020719 TaxID=3154896 RepID=UPI003403FCCE